MKTPTQKLWRDSELPVIVDASALDWLEPTRPLPKNAIRVITPHPGEAARLLDTTVTARCRRTVRGRCAKFRGALAIAGSC